MSLIGEAFRGTFHDTRRSGVRFEGIGVV